MTFLHRAMDWPELLLPDGRRADGLRCTELRRVLEAIGVPDMPGDGGKQELLAAYSKYATSTGRVAVVDQESPEPRARRRGIKIDAAYISRTAEKVIRDAANARVDGPPAAPHHPIATTRV